MADITLVERTRHVLAAEDDDFFNAETILYYLNKSQRKVVSFFVAQERNDTVVTTEEGQRLRQNRNASFRALDKLRRRENITPTNVQEESRFWRGNVVFPNNQTQFLYLEYDKNTTLRELTSQTRFKLNWAAAVPTKYEGYYYVSGDQGNIVFEVYLHEDPEGKDVTVFHVVNPTQIQMNTTEFADLPEQLENAVIYGAAVMMAAQEKSANVQTFEGIYQKELQSNLY